LLPRRRAGELACWQGGAGRAPSAAATARCKAAPREAGSLAASPELMVLVPEPESGDRDVLLSGPHGNFIDNMLRAMGLAAGEVYFASALPRPLPGADWHALAASGLGEVLRHHVALAAPRRLVAFGSNILPLFGNDLPQSPAGLREINLEGRSIPLLFAREIAGLLGRPRWKAELWRSWLGWESRPAGQ